MLRKLTQQKHQSGFTLIELVMVIVILGILASFALAKFADLSSEARAASLSGLAGAMKSASGITRSVQMVNGAGVGADVVLDGTSILMHGGSPRASVEGIIRAASITAGETSSADVDYWYDNEISPMTFSLAGFVQAGCEVVYTEAVVLFGGFSITPATVDLDVSGC